jgi:hypothetical protein
MDAIRIDRAQATVPAEARNAEATPKQSLAAEIRSLQEWELLLASGGEGSPEWPTK